MNKSLLTTAALFIATLPYAAHAQGTIRGAEEGAAAGEKAAGPLGAIVGGAIGAATGTIGGVLGVEEPRFREYVVREYQPTLGGHYGDYDGYYQDFPPPGYAYVPGYPYAPDYAYTPEYRYAPGYGYTYYRRHRSYRGGPHPR